MGIRHAKTSVRGDGADPTQVQPSDWNTDHDAPATGVTYDHATSGLSANDVQHALDEIAGRTGASASGSALLSGGGVAWTGGLNFTVSAAVYLIAGLQYSSAQTNLTLTTADGSFDRIDIIAVDNTGSAIVITGIAAPVPAAPDVDPASQLELTFAYVAASATTPTNVTSETLYLENTEYTTSTTAPSRINLASTSNPFAGTTDIDATAAANGDQIALVKPSGTLALGSYTSLTMNIRSKAAWPKAKSLSVAWLSGTTVVSAAVGLKSGAYGFDSSITGAYQQVVVPIAAFGTGTVDRLRIAVAGGGAAIGFYLDNIILQGGTASGGGSTGKLFPIEEDGVSVVAAATSINAGHGLDVTDQGSGVAGLAVDETELDGSLIPGITSGPGFATPSITYGTAAAGAAATTIRSDSTIAKPTEADLSTSDVTTGDVSTSKHGYAPKAPNDATKYLDGTGAYSVPGGPGITYPYTVTWTSNVPDGVFNVLGTLAGTRPFINPCAFTGGGSGLYRYETALVTATQSTNQDGTRTADKATDHGLDSNTECSHTQNIANSWWKADFGSGRTLTPTRLAIVGRSAGTTEPRNFKLQGSNNDSSWTDLLTVTNDGPTDNDWWSSAVSGAAAYRYLRIFETGVNDNSTNYLILGEVEMWGTLA